MKYSNILLLCPDLKELASQYKVKYMETSTELCHNLDELLVEMLLKMRKQRVDKMRLRRRSSFRIVMDKIRNVSQN